MNTTVRVADLLRHRATVKSRPNPLPHQERGRKAADIPSRTIQAISQKERQVKQLQMWEKILLPEMQEKPLQRFDLTIDGSDLVGEGIPSGSSMTVDLYHYPRPLFRDLCVILVESKQGDVRAMINRYERPTIDGCHIVCKVDEDGKTKYARRRVTRIYGVVVAVHNAAGECVWSKEDELESFPTEPPTFAHFYADSKWEEQMVSETLGTPWEAACLAKNRNLYDKYIAEDIAEAAAAAIRQAGNITTWECSNMTLATIWNAGRIQGIREERYKRRQRRERSAAPCEE